MLIGCTQHPGTDAVYECVPCGAYLCTACVKLIGSGTKEFAQCLTCQSLATPLASRKKAGRAIKQGIDAHSGFWERLPSVLPFLKDKDLLYTLAGLAVLAGLLRQLPLVNLLALGLEAAAYFHIVSSSANGVDDYETPDIDDLYEQVFGPLIRYLAGLLPLIFALVWWGKEEKEGGLNGFVALAVEPATMVDSVSGLLVLLAIALWPLLTVIAALQRSVTAVLNPITWVHTLAVLRVDYVIAMAAFYAVLAVEVLIGVPLRVALEVHVPVPILPGMVGLFIGYLFMALRARILGEVCRPYVE